MTKKAEHHCHAMNCQASCRPQLLMCPKHWRMVPKALKQRVYQNYQSGQATGQVKASKEWHAAANEAIQAVFEKERGIKAMRQERKSNPELFGNAMQRAADFDHLRERLEQWESQEPVARVLHWVGPGDEGRQCVRTYTEFPVSTLKDGYWKEGRQLYFAPSSPPPHPQELADQETVTLPLEPSYEHLCSIAMRYRHDFGLLTGMDRELALGVARQMYEEVTGQGFFKLSKKEKK